MTERNVKTKRVVKEKEVRFQEIRNAAKKMFLKKGYQNTTVEDVAKKAKISKGALYQYFKNKDDLYYALMFPMLEKLGMLHKRFEEKLDKGLISSGDVFFQTLLDDYMELYEFDPDAIRIYQIFQLNGLFSRLSENANQRLNEFGYRNYGLLREVIKKSADIGILPETDPVVIADIVWATFLGVIQLEENKLRFTKKDHIRSTLGNALLLIAKGISKKEDLSLASK